MSPGEISSRVDHLRELRIGGKTLCIPVAALQRCGHALKSVVNRGHDNHCEEQANEVPLGALQLVRVHDSCPTLYSIAMQQVKPLTDYFGPQLSD